MTKPDQDPAYRATILDRAKALTTNDRNHTYGAPYDNMADTAALWSCYLSGVNGVHVQITPAHAAVMLALFKLGRTVRGEGLTHEDSLIDAAAYAAIAAECAAL